MEDSNLHRLFLFLSHCSCSFITRSSQGGKTLPLIWERGTNKAKVGPVKGGPCTCFSLPAPAKPSGNSGADRLAAKKEGARGDEGEFHSFFKSATKPPPPAVSSSPCVSFLPLHEPIYNHPIYFPALGHLPHVKETSSSLSSLMGL